MTDTPGEGRWQRAQNRAGELLRASTEKVGAIGAHARPHLGGGREFALRQARAFQRRARAVWLPEEPETILSRSSLFEPLPASGPAPELRSLAWRGDALLGLSAVGALALEDEIVGITRSLFHDGIRHQDLSQRLFGADFDAIHGFMDTVPGSTVRGGGILHRLQHGHDLGAARQIHEEHGIPGLLVWVQHMAQDATTPTGVPIPVGGVPLSEWLVEEGLATPGKAALLVSFNIAELAAAVLAGTFMLRLTVLLTEVQKRRRVRRRVERARDAWEAGDLDAVIAHYREARSLAAQREPGLDLALGWAYAAAGRPTVEAFLAFRSAAEGLASHDHTLDLDGLVLSLRGTAYLLALSHAVQVLELDDLRGAWRSELVRMAQGGIASFESLAIAQDEQLAVGFGERRLQFRPRPLSAAANYYLAARIAAGASFLRITGELERLRARAVQLLGRAEKVHSGQPSIAAVRERWSAELAPVRLVVAS